MESSQIESPASRVGLLPEQFSDFCRELKNGILIWLLPAVICTAFYINYSEYAGRLAITLGYDDITYCTDGLGRLRVLENQGITAFIQNWFDNQPHSPVSTLQAMIGFSIFGPEDWAPYATNIVYLLLLLLIFHFFTKGLPVWTRLLLLLILLCPPMVANIIVEFRPDIPSALLLCCGVILAFDGAYFWQRPWRQSLVGLFLGLSLLVKPTAFMALIPTAVGIFGLIGIQELIFRRTETSYSRLLKGIGVGLGTFCVVGIPYVWANATGYIGYMKYAFYSPEKPIGNYTGTLSDSLLYYWNGEGARFLVGGQIVNVFFLVCVCSVIYLIVKRQGEILGKVLAYLCVLVVLYSGPTLMPVKTIFFGANFDLLCLLLLIGGLAMWLHRFPRFSLAPTFLAWAIIFGTGNRNLPYSSPSTRLKTLNTLSNELAELMPTLSGPNQTNVLVTALTSIDNYTLRYSLLKKGYTNINFDALFMQSTLDAYPTTLNSMDIVIGSEPGNPDTAGAFPANVNEETTLCQIRSREDFCPIDHLMSHNGKGFWIFGKRRPFYGFVWDDHLFTPTPVRDSQAPVYAGDPGGNSVLLFYPTPGEFRFNIDLTLISPLTDQVIHVACNGKEVGICHLPMANKWNNYTFDLNPALLNDRGDNVLSFYYERIDPGAPPVYFQQIDIRPVSAGVWAANRGALEACHPEIFSKQ